MLGRLPARMRATLEVINRMQADGVIGKYAIGGAVGATFYLEPSATLDIDIFISLKTPSDSSLVTLSPIYDYLASRGRKAEKEYIIIEGWPVQFLPASDALDEEALAQAAETEVEDVRTWVMTAEHLVAIALRTGRAERFHAHPAICRERSHSIPQAGRDPEAPRITCEVGTIRR